MDTLFGETGAWQFGPKGFDLIAASANTSGAWYKLSALGGTIAFSAVTCQNSPDLSGITMSAGQDIYGYFTRINYTGGTGSLIAYKIR